MTANTYILCPGQGAQVVGMGKDFYEASGAAREVFDRANEIIGFDLKAVCFAGPDEKLNQTDVSQPAIFVTSVASFQAAREAGLLDVGAVTTYAGLSLGEYTALHLAGVFSFDDGVKLVAARGRYMQEAALASPSGMVALLGADEATANQICADAAQGEVLVPANFNAPGQIVVSGSKAACEHVLEKATAAGLKATALKVAGAFHSPLMQPAAARMKAELDHVQFSPRKTDVYANVTADLHADAEQMKRLLVQQIVAPVRWEQIMAKLIASDANARFIELAPNRHLAGLAKRINRRLPIESLATAEAISVTRASRP
jgi:[acyl-carrier-protein] S-malonyltransferase